MSHERSMTFEEDGKYYLVPSVVNDKQLSPRMAWKYAKRTKKFLGIFNTEKEATEYAKKRSDMAGRVGRRGLSRTLIGGQ